MGCLKLFVVYFFDVARDLNVFRTLIFRSGKDLCDKQMLRCSENSLQVRSDGTIGSNLILKIQ